MKRSYSTGLGLSHTEPITLEYDREAQTVKFTSTNFDYIQTDVPKDVTYAIGVLLSKPPMEIQAKFIHI